MSKHRRHTTHPGVAEDRRPACHYDRDQGARVTRDGDPCTEDHCVLCAREHTTTAHPVTCPGCIGNVRAHFDEIRWLCRHLRFQAARGTSTTGRLNAAAPIPGADAMVLLGPTPAGGYDDLLWAPTLDDDHSVTTLVPPLLTLAGWSHQWRHHRGRPDLAAPTIRGILADFADHLHEMAQTSTGPDWVGFVADIAALRRQLEQVLHDEQDPQRGVPCFECGTHLVRRFGEPNPCRHRTPARDRLDAEQRRADAGRRVLATLATYPELATGPAGDYPHGYTPAEQAAARPPAWSLVLAAREPCDRCAGQKRGQGGIENPAEGQSWECPGCRMHYTPGQYANAVRSHLLKSGPDGDGWTHIAMAAEAATTQTGIAVPPGTVRKWMDRGKVSGLCRWTAGSRWGQRLVFWPDVADEAAAMVQRMHDAEVARRIRAEQLDLLRDAIAGGRDPWEVGKQHGVHPSRLEALLVELEREARQAAS